MYIILLIFYSLTRVPKDVDDVAWLNRHFPFLFLLLSKRNSDVSLLYKLMLFRCITVEIMADNYKCQDNNYGKICQYTDIQSIFVD